MISFQFCSIFCRDAVDFIYCAFGAASNCAAITLATVPPCALCRTFASCKYLTNWQRERNLICMNDARFKSHCQMECHMPQQAAGGRLQPAACLESAISQMAAKNVARPRPVCHTAPPSHCACNCPWGMCHKSRSVSLSMLRSLSLSLPLSLFLCLC